MKTQLLKVLTVAMLFLMPNVNFGQERSIMAVAPDLGAASSFAVFTAVGAFNVSGASTAVTGDVGTDEGAFNGFPPGNLIDGAIHWNDPTSVLAAAAVHAAYGALSGITPCTVLGVTLGSGQTLTPDVYCTGAETTLNGVLTLDGEGDPDALFIFKIDGEFSTGEFSEVNLIRSASLCNVYWWISGQFTLGASSFFRGNIVGGGAIHLLEGASFEGRALTRAGAIDLHNNSVINSCERSPSIPISTWALVLGGALIAIGVFVSYRHIV